MIPTGEIVLETNASSYDRWCPQVPTETMETQIQVKITLYDNFIAGTCGIHVFYSLNLCLHPCGILGAGDLQVQVNLPVVFFHRLPVGILHTFGPMLSPILNFSQWWVALQDKEDKGPQWWCHYSFSELVGDLKGGIGGYHTMLFWQFSFWTIKRETTLELFLIFTHCRLSFTFILKSIQYWTEQIYIWLTCLYRHAK